MTEKSEGAAAMQRHGRISRDGTFTPAAPVKLEYADTPDWMPVTQAIQRWARELKGARQVFETPQALIDLAAARGVDLRGTEIINITLLDGVECPPSGNEVTIEFRKQ